MDYHQFIETALKLKQAASTRRHAMVAPEQDAADALELGDRPRATAAIDAVLTRQPEAIRWWHELALLRLQDGDETGAAAAWRRALCCDLEDLPLLQRIGQALAAAGHDPASFAEHAWASQPDTPPASPGGSPRSPGLQTACLDVLRNDWTKALPFFRQLHQTLPARRRAAKNLAFLLERLGQPGQARCVLAVNRLAQDRPRDAVEAFEAAPNDARSPEFLDKFLCALRLAGEEQRAVEVAATVAPAACPPLAYWQWAEALLDLHRYGEAVETLRLGASVHGDEYLKLQAGLILPRVPDSQASLERAHERVRHAIHALSDAPLPASADSLANLEEALGPNFFQAYLGAPCIDEARAYGHFARRVMQARFPHDDEPRTARRRNRGERIRIGYATRFTTWHVVMRYFAGWLQHADRDAFELHLFPLDSETSWATHYLSSLVDTCHPPATDTETAARQIRDSLLDVLVYPEIGMDPLSFRLAAMRLAPVQCAAGGHPVTTGLPTVDYFLSSAAAEPANAGAHYTERLVALPGLSVCMPFPTLPDTRKSRADFGLADDQVVYLSSQSLFKYLPCHDDAFARIAVDVDVENAVFVFVEGPYPAWTRTFAARLRRTFEARGLSPDRHLRFVARQSYSSFLCLNAVSDVFLDPIGGWAGTTAIDALACGLPVVTLPGATMRSRQSFALLTQLGIGDTIATDIEDYLRLAIALGKDAGRRAELSRRILDRHHVLFDDVHSVKALEAFYRWAAGSARPGDERMFNLA